ncbi:MAG: hypothetical protein OWQ51_12590 [Pyrobaculum arsenaticum]|uniref:PaREP8 n=1 Tax=Pyrobaculum arsenaticum (strain DSM 13514 / JCM 11321 / PZ6) TaxID=340102 RepID=A4WMH2_PYRAR|nr:PaREP1 family protein [Pyrobaculum arsenaticum]ABP51589.1 paREP8 [Pyrobaculum arsenaticum DSM 13514]MCY0891779.1 hypothetical protein [Pyrobaculum arsenaticum]
MRKATCHGEKYWIAVAALQNAIAERRGWEHFSRRDFIIGQLCEELGDADVVRQFRTAEGLRANFYHNFMDGKIFDLHRADVFALIERLRRCLGQRGRPA